MIQLTTVHTDKKAPGLFIRIPKRIAQELAWPDKALVSVQVVGGKVILSREVQ